MSLNNKIAVITGASRGIGRAIALYLGRQGANVIVTARHKQELQELVLSIKNEGGKASAVTLDITDETAIRQFASDLVDSNTVVDILINNAGIGSFQPVTDTDTHLWDETMNVNVKGTFLMCKYLVPLMQAQKSGHIISIASDVSKRTFADGALYCASKYAQDAFCSALRKEVRKDNIKVSVVYPGLVETWFNNNTPGSNGNNVQLNPEDIAASVCHILTAPAHVVIDELMIHPISQEY
jgi:NADP-dependent 3-hydroxy acid dehydrogenase YdfG